MIENLHPYADFTPPYSSGIDIAFVIEKPGDVPKFEVFAYPFSQGVWIACLVVLIAATWFSKWITASMTSLSNTFLSLFGSMLRQPLDISVDSLDRWVWWTTWWIFSAVVSTVYIALFFSFMTMPTKGLSVKNFQHLSAAVLDKNFRAFTDESFNMFMENSPEEHLRLLAAEITKNGWMLDGKNKPTVNKTSAWIGNREYLESQLIPPLNKIKMYSEDSLSMLHRTINVWKKFCCKEELNIAMLEAAAFGLLDYYWKLAYQNKTWSKELVRAEAAVGDEDPLPLNLEDVKFAFYLLLIGYLLSVVVFLSEVIIPKRIVIRMSQSCTCVPRRPPNSRKRN